LQNLEDQKPVLMLLAETPASKLKLELGEIRIAVEVKPHMNVQPVPVNYSGV